MREQHSLDDLFARALRHAEAVPSEAVWEGILQERDWAHLTLLRIRRRWGWLSLILLLCGTAGYLGITYTGEKRAEVRGTSSTNSNTIVPNSSMGAPSPVGANASLNSATTENPERTSSATTNTPMSYSLSTDWQPTVGASVPEDEAAKTGNGLTRRTQGRSTKALAISNLAVTAETEQPFNPTAVQVALAVSEGPTTGPISGEPTADIMKTLPKVAPTHDRKDQSGTPGMEPGRVGLLAILPTKWEQELLTTDPRGTSSPTFMGPRQAWWMAVSIGQYRETRTWHGGDAMLVNALHSTETPHRTTNFGVIVGLEGRKGWGFATGIEYGAAHYDFQHFDQFRSTQDSLVTHVITFNTLVLDSYVDTVSTFTEVRRTVAAVNHYTTIRVPLEGSWHKAWRRWHLGLRGGVAVEFNTMRSGVTLMSADGGTRSVDVSTTEKRTATLVSGGLALDVGYALTERLGLWASPGYAAGLFSLSPTDGSPYAMPERFGVRVRLAYTLRPGR